MNIPAGNGRLYIDNGPVQMLVVAENNGRHMMKEEEKAGMQVNNLLTRLVKELPTARRPWPELAGKKSFPGVLGKMVTAARETESPDMTPMCAVAGAFADMTADYIANRGATRVMVNNGGDIAIRLKGAEQASLGVSNRVGSPPVWQIRLRADTGVGGVATSGLGGRSFTLGVADAVTVFAATASVADACATHIANTTGIDSPHIHRRPAREIDPDTDIPELLVTTEVEPLTKMEIARALARAEERTRYLMGKGTILGAMIFVQGQHRFVLPETLVPIRIQQQD